MKYLEGEYLFIDSKTSYARTKKCTLNKEYCGYVKNGISIHLCKKYASACDADKKRITIDNADKEKITYCLIGCDLKNSISFILEDE